MFLLLAFGRIRYTSSDMPFLFSFSFIQIYEFTRAKNESAPKKTVDTVDVTREECRIVSKTQLLST
jgi:hypothetical protein